ncbi:MAG TPA: OmpA family protein [Reyranella sp.]|nr:OmpA family protein [Reyranella sp.]
MTKLGSLVIAGILLGAVPSFAQSPGTCPTSGSSAQEQPAWVLFDLGSAVLRPEAKPTIAQAVATAKARQSVKVCVVGQTDKLGDKNYNAKLAQARSQAVAAELVRQGLAGNKVVIATNPEAFSNISFGSHDASEKDRRVTIVFR